MSYYETLLTIYLSISFICCSIVSSQYHKYKHTPLKLAPAILWLGFVTEFSATLYSNYIEVYNGWIFNGYTFFFYLLLYILVLRYLKNIRFKITTVLLGSAALLFFVYRFFSTGLYNDRFIYANAVLILVFLISCAMYLAELLQRPTQLEFRKHPEFFLLGGYLIFHLIYTPLSVAYDQELRIFSSEFYITLISIQSYILIAMNLLFIYIFIWTRKAHL